MSITVQPYQMRRRSSTLRVSLREPRSSTCNPNPCPILHARPSESQHRLGNDVLCKYWAMINRVCTSAMLPWSRILTWRRLLERLKKVCDRDYRSCGSIPGHDNWQLRAKIAFRAQWKTIVRESDTPGVPRPRSWLFSSLCNSWKGFHKSSYAWAKDGL